MPMTRLQEKARKKYVTDLQIGGEIMKKKTKQKLGQAIAILLFHIGAIAWIWFGFATATTLR